MGDSEEEEGRKKDPEDREMYFPGSWNSLNPNLSKPTTCSWAPGTARQGSTCERRQPLLHHGVCRALFILSGFQMRSNYNKGEVYVGQKYSS